MWDTIPLDVVRHIFSFLCPSSFNAMACTSRGLYNYHTFVFSCDVTNNSYSSPSSSSCVDRVNKVGSMWDFITSVEALLKSTFDLILLNYRLCSAIEQWNSFTQYSEFQVEFPVHIVQKTIAIGHECCLATNAVPLRTVVPPMIIRFLLSCGIAVPSTLVVITERVYWESIFPISNYRMSEEKFLDAYECIEIHKSHRGDCLCTQCFCHICYKNFDPAVYVNDDIFTSPKNEGNNENDSDEQLEFHPLYVRPGGRSRVDIPRFSAKEDYGKSRGQLKLQTWLPYQKRARKRTKAQQSRVIRHSRQGPSNS